MSATIRSISHADGFRPGDEILFGTRFDYMFPEAACSPDCLLEPTATTQTWLVKLGDALAMDNDPGDAAMDSEIPAAYTYLGQFIDHDITARTDRELPESESIIANPDGSFLPFAPLDPHTVASRVKNGRRPFFDLDSVYGDGPSLFPGYEADADAFFDDDRCFRLQALSPGFDLPRTGRKAIIADARNDENLNVSQLHAVMMSFHNAAANTAGGGTADFIRGRQLARWAYQFTVLHDYLPRVCDPKTVEDTIANGPRYYAPGEGHQFMPLEFSVAAFRFGHSMIRPEYRLNGSTTKSISDLMGVSARHKTLLESVAGGYRLKQSSVIDWKNYVEIGGSNPQKARRINPLIASGLGDLTLDGIPAGTILAHLAKRNLLRAYLFSIPTGQAVARIMGITPLSEDDLAQGASIATEQALIAGGFLKRTPLWYYILQEAQVQKDGASLGAVGSRIVAETIVGLIKRDPNSYLNAKDPAIHANGITVGGKRVDKLSEIVAVAGAPH